MENEKITNRVIYEDEDTEGGDTPLSPTEIEEAPEQTPEQILEKAGILSNGEVKELPPPLTATQKQKEYKRKMTEKRLEALKKAREAKKAKRERIMKDGALPHLPRLQAELKEKEQPVKQVKQMKEQPKAQSKAQPKAQVKKETDDERIERLVMEKLDKLKPKQSQPKAQVKKETDEERIERLVQERLKKYKPKEPELTPKQRERQEREAYFSKLLFGE